MTRIAIILVTSLALLASIDAPSALAQDAGLVRLLVTDVERDDPRAANGHREWMVDLYYPIDGEPGDPLPYGRDAALLAAMAGDEYYGVAASQIHAWRHGAGVGVTGARAAGGSRPLILLSPGLGVAAFNYQLLAGRLVDHGYAVAVVDHPYLGTSLLPDGRLQRASDLPALGDLGPDNSESHVRGWSHDLVVTLNALAAERLPDDLLLDFDHIAAVGHSLGGAVALDACHTDTRITACLDFEGAPFGSRLMTEGAAGNMMIVLSRPRPDNGAEAGAGGGPRAMLVDLLGQGDGIPGWFVAVTGGAHMSFSDAPHVMPDTLTRFGGTVMEPDRSMTVYSALTHGFLQAAWHGASFSGVLDTLPEAEGEQAG